MVLLWLNLHSPAQKDKHYILNRCSVGMVFYSWEKLQSMIYHPDSVKWYWMECCQWWTATPADWNFLKKAKDGIISIFNSLEKQAEVLKPARTSITHGLLLSTLSKGITQCRLWGLRLHILSKEEFKYVYNFMKTKRF